jgi:hypothetical protein
MKRFAIMDLRKNQLDLRAWIKNELTTKNCWELIRYLFMGGIGVLSYLFFSNLYNWLGVETFLSPVYAWLSGLIIVYFGHMKFN